MLSSAGNGDRRRSGWSSSRGMKRHRSSQTRVYRKGHLVLQVHVMFMESVKVSTLSGNMVSESIRQAETTLYISARLDPRLLARWRH